MIICLDKFEKKCYRENFPKILSKVMVGSSGTTLLKFQSEKEKLPLRQSLP